MPADANHIIHACTHPAWRDEAFTSEREMFEEMHAYLERLFRVCRWASQQGTVAAARALGLLRAGMRPALRSSGGLGCPEMRTAGITHIRACCMPPRAVQVVE